MQNELRKDTQHTSQKPRLRLPFEKRHVDFGTWAYIHRAGLSAAVIALLVFGIVFVSWRISIGSSVPNVVYMQFEFPDQVQDEPRPEIPEQNDPLDYSDVTNQISNDNAELNPNIRDAQGVNAEELYSEAGKLSEQMRANREAFEAGIRAQQEMLNSRGAKPNTEEQGPRETAKVQGNVTVSYSFENPVRNHEILDVPAYRCKGGGTVVVNAVLDVNGYVVSAAVDRSQSSSNDCLQREAVASARASRFDLNTKAPAKQRGTITYIFVPQ